MITLAHRWRPGVATLTMLVIATLITPTVAQADVAGPATVIDGDTLEVAGERIRLHGIDAPESAQTCGRQGVTWLCGAEASAKLRELVRGAEVRCVGLERDRYDRLIAACHAGGVDINAAMVSAGLALAYRRYSEDYVGQETMARVGRAGMWSGRFVPPWDWRQGKRLTTAAANDNRPPPAPTTAPPASTVCIIKGNVSSRGERIYHVPGGQYYDRTRIDPSKGERMFCSEAEAQAAGWRRSLRFVIERVRQR